MNILDLLIIFLLFMGIIYGALRGGGKMITGLLSIWLALVLSLWLYRPFSEKILAGVFTSVSPVILESFSFIVLMIVFTGLVSIVLLFTNKAPEEKKKKKAKDLDEVIKQANKSNFSIPSAMGGMVVGFIVTALWLSIIFALTQYIVYANPASSPALASNMKTSLLLPYLNSTLNYLYLSVKFFTPNQIPAIFGAML